MSLMRRCYHCNRKRMFGITFRCGGNLEDVVGRIAIIRINRSDARLAVSECACLVEQDSIDFSQLLQIDAAFDNGSLASSTADCSQNCQRSTGSNSAGPSQND